MHIVGLFRTLVAIAIVSSILGCGSGNGSSITGRFGTLTFAASPNKTTFNTGEAVNFTFTATNTGTTPITVTGDGFADVANPVPVVARVERFGSLVTRILKNSGNSTSVTIGPGETKTGKVSWDQTDTNGTPVPSGNYVVTVLMTANTVNGTVTTAPQDAFAAVPFSIVIL